MRRPTYATYAGPAPITLLSDQNSSSLTRSGIKSYLSNAQSYPKNKIISDLESIGLKIKGQSPDGRFMEFVDKYGNVRAKIHPSDKLTKFDHLHLYNKSGNSLNSNLNVVERSCESAHIRIGEHL